MLVYNARAGGSRTYDDSFSLAEYHASLHEPTMKYLFVILTVLTTYSHSTFVTKSYVDVARPIEDANPYIDSLVYDFQTNPDRLFSWAFKANGIPLKKTHIHSMNQPVSRIID